jgi:hypothetical protein
LATQSIPDWFRSRKTGADDTIALRIEARTELLRNSVICLVPALLPWPVGDREMRIELLTAAAGAMIVAAALVQAMGQSLSTAAVRVRRAQVRRIKGR